MYQSHLNKMIFKNWLPSDVIAKRHRVSLGGDENVLEVIIVMVAKLCKYNKSHWVAHFLKIYFIQV